MKENLLIVGRESFIGSHLVNFCLFNNIPHISTTRRRAQVTSNTIYIDLLGHAGKLAILEKVHSAVICAGMTHLGDCEKEPVLSKAVNVEGMIRLMDIFQKKRIRTVYLSTNQVFDGSKPFERTDSPQNPVSVYGMQKAEVEKRLIENNRSWAIIRLTKVLHPQSGIFKEWINLLKRQNHISPFLNMNMAPIFVDQVVRIIHEVVQQPYNGIFHVSGKEDISYADAAYYFAQQLNVASELIRPVNADPSALPLGSLPKHTTLDTSNTIEKIGEPIMDAWQILDMILKDEA